MTTQDWIAIWGIGVTIFLAVIGSSIALSYKVGTIHHLVESMKLSVTGIPTMKISIAEMRVKVDELWWQKTTESSGVSQLTDSYYSEIFEKVKSASPKNAFQVQEATVLALLQYKVKSKCKEMLEIGAYNSGVDVDTVYYLWLPSTLKTG